MYTHEVTLRHHKRKRESTVIGHARLLALGGPHSRTVKVKLTAAGLRFLQGAKHQRLAVVLDATVKGGKSTSKHTTIHAATAKRRRSGEPVTLVTLVTLAVMAATC